MPITYRNINAPDFTQAAALLSGANESFNSGMDRFINTISQVQEARVNEVRGRRQLNESNFRDYLQSFASPEDLAAAQASGEVDRQLATYAGVIDQNAVRGAADERVNALRAQAKATFDFENARREQADAPVLAEYDMEANALMQSDPSQLDAAVDRLRQRIMADERDGRISAQGAAQALKQLGVAGESAETEFQDDTDRARNIARDDFRFGRDQLEASRDDATYNREQAQIARTDEIENISNQFASLAGRASSATDLRNQFAASIAKLPGITQAEVGAATAAFDQRLAAPTQLAAADEQRFEAAQASLDAQYKADTNVFLQADRQAKEVDAASEAANIVKEFSGEETVLGSLIDSNQETRGQISREIVRALTDGITVAGADGKQTKVRMPPGLVRTAMASIVDNWGVDSTLEGELKEYLLNNEELLQQLQNYDDYRAASSQLQGARDALRFKEFARGQ